MSGRRLPVRPNLTQLKNQAKDLLLRFRGGEPPAVEEFRKHHPEKISSAEAKLADAQLVLARSYEASGWTRLVLACKLIDAIWRDDLETVRSIIEKNPQLLHENAGIRNSNWGPPMSYAANLGRDAIIRMLYEHGARDLEHAIGRATLQGKIETASMLYAMLGAPPVSEKISRRSSTVARGNPSISVMLPVTPTQSIEGSKPMPSFSIVSRKPTKSNVSAGLSSTQPPLSDTWPRLSIVSPVIVSLGLVPSASGAWSISISPLSDNVVTPSA